MLARPGRTCVGVYLKSSTSVVGRAQNITLHSRGLADLGALSCDLEFSPPERKCGVIVARCQDGLLKLGHVDVLL